MMMVDEDAMAKIRITKKTSEVKIEHCDAIYVRGGVSDDHFRLMLPGADMVGYGFGASAPAAELSSFHDTSEGLLSSILAFQRESISPECRMTLSYLVSCR